MEKSHGTEKNATTAGSGWTKPNATGDGNPWELGIKRARTASSPFNKTYDEGDAKRRHLQQVKERTEAPGKESVYQYLLTHPCVGSDGKGCPYHETDPQVLEFHHRDKSKKDMDVTHMLSGESDKS